MQNNKVKIETRFWKTNNRKNIYLSSIPKITLRQLNKQIGTHIKFSLGAEFESLYLICTKIRLFVDSMSKIISNFPVLLYLIELSIKNNIHRSIH